jgi:alpha-L-rhamnosidase
MLFQKAKWIGYITGVSEKNAEHGAPSPFLRKCFNASKVKKAEIRITSLGLFKAYLNGKELGADVLLPGWTDYNKRIYYYIFDITDKIRKKNCIGVILGDGWYMGNIAWFGRMHYGDYPLKLLAEIVLDYGEGKQDLIVTDDTWQASSGYIVYSDILNGEFHDGRLRVGNFSSYNYVCNWDKAQIQNDICLQPQAAVCEPTVINRKFKAKKISDSGNTAIYDCEQNFAGIIRAVIVGKEGTKIRFRYAEMLYPDGSFYTENLRTAKASDYYICAGKGKEVFQPLFTYHGFRYIEVTIDGPAKIVSLCGYAIYNCLRETGSFNCSDPIVNKIYENAFWSQRSNFVSLPTDCPQRDERLGWTGDAQIFCGSAMFNMRCDKFFEKYLTDIRDAQAENGMVDCVAPSVRKDFDGVKGAAGWGDAIAVIPYTHYVMYGDKEIIMQNLGSVKKWLKYCLDTSNNLICPSKGYGDWLNVSDETDKSVLATAFFAYSTLLAAKMCRIVQDKESDVFFKLYEDIKAAFISNFVDGDYRIKSDTQTCYLIAYSFGLLDLNQAKKPLLEAIARKNNHLSAGFIGIKYLLPTLCEMGESALAYELITKITYPSWGYSVINGATTIWERWNSYTKECGFADIRMNSFNHYSMGSCVEWIYKYVLGIMPCEEPDYAGFKRVKMRPFMDKTGKISEAGGFYDSINGKIEVKWKNNKELYFYEAKIPKSIEVEFEFPEFDIIEQRKAGDKYLYLLKKSI